MGRSNTNKTQGGQVRSACLPCGKIIRGKRERLITQIRCHQKVCSGCKSLDLSYLWKREYETDGNATDIRTSASGGMAGVGKTNRLTLQTEDGESFQTTRVGGLGDTLRQRQKEFTEQKRKEKRKEKPIKELDAEYLVKIDDEDFDEFRVDMRTGMILREITTVGGYDVMESVGRFDKNGKIIMD